MRWEDLHEGQPRLAAIAAERLVAPGVLLVVTIRADGTPRLSPVEPFVLDGDLWLSMMLGSLKAADLVRDPRVLVHSIVTSRDGEEGEVKLRSEEHTSELQSRLHLVCRLLLEKKKKKIQNKIIEKKNKIYKKKKI